MTKFMPVSIISQYDRYGAYILVACSVTLILGLYLGFSAPFDYQMGGAVRIMYIHVPSAWLALLIYSFMALLSLFSFIYKNQSFSLMAVSLAPIGAVFCLITLVTGSLWGRPMWGTYWVFDARLTSTLVLFLLYLGYIAIYNAYDSYVLASKLAALVAIIGFINIPIIKFSVNIWNSLHQDESVLRLDGPTIDPVMLRPLLIMFLALALFCYYIFLMRFKILFLEKGRRNVNNR